MTLDELMQKVGQQYKYISLTYIAEGNTRWKVNASTGDENDKPQFVNVRATDSPEEGLELILKGELENSTYYAK